MLSRTAMSPSFHNHLILWYEQNKRTLPWRETEDPYHVWLSEVILQQTRVQQGMAYYLRFVETWPTVEALADASEDDILHAWQGLGYYTRARNLHKAAQQIATSGTGFPTTFEELISLPGVGEYTAGAILSFALNQPYPAVDGNVYRVLARLMDCDEAFDTTPGKKRFRELAWSLLDRNRPRLYNSAIMELGALHCTPTLRDEEGTETCLSCPVAEHCLAFQHGTAAMLPVRKPRPKVRDRYFLYHVFLTPDGQTLLHRREEKDIWQHLYEFPLEELTEPCPLLPSDHHYTHVLSHQRIHATFRLERVRVLPSIPNCFPVTVDRFSDYALAQLTHKYLLEYAIS